MDTASALLMGQLNKNNPAMVFDWNRAAQLIRERKAKNASAGLSGDWEWTGGAIFDGKPLSRDRTYTYLASPWATPELEIDGQTIDCLSIQEAAPDWDAKTFWPIQRSQSLTGPEMNDMTPIQLRRMIRKCHPEGTLHDAVKAFAKVMP